jgi:hypothetical protein
MEYLRAAITAHLLRDITHLLTRLEGVVADTETFRNMVTSALRRSRIQKR